MTSAQGPATLSTPTSFRTWLGGPMPIKLGSLLVVAVGWEATARMSGSILFAPLSSVLVALGTLGTDPSFWLPMLDSFAALVLGLVTASVLGVAIGAMLGHFRSIGRVGILYAAFFLAVPMSALVPVVVVAEGIGLTARATVVFMFVFFEVVWNSYLGVRNADQALVEMGRSFGASDRQLFTRILIPSALPAILAGLRLGTGRAFIGMVSAELLLASVGIGLLITRFEARFQAPELFATILILLIIAALVQTVVHAVEGRLLARYAPK